MDVANLVVRSFRYLPKVSSKIRFSSMDMGTGDLPVCQGVINLQVCMIESSYCKTNSNTPNKSPTCLKARYTPNPSANSQFLVVDVVANPIPL